MRLLLIASSFPPVAGGAETYAATFAGGLAGLGHQVTVVTDVPRDGSPADPAADPDGVTVRRFAGYRSLIDDPSKIRWEQMTYGILPELAACAAECRPELVVTNSLDAAHLGKLIALELDLPWVAAFHEHAPEEEPVGRGRLRFVYDTLRPSLVLAGSEFYAERARRWGPEVPFALIHHGVDTDAFGPDVSGREARRAYGFAAEELVIVSAGRLKPRKGMRELVSAVSLVREHHRQVRLLIVGSISSASAEYAEQLERDIERLGLGEVVTVDQTVPFERMPAILAAADIVVQASWEEGLGLSVLEAMSAAKPTVTTDVVGVREILRGEEVALVVPPKEPRAIAAALTTLVESPAERRRFGSRARWHVLDHFSRELMVRKTEAALRRVVREETRPGVPGVRV